jgi:TIR domain
VNSAFEQRLGPGRVNQISKHHRQVAQRDGDGGVGGGENFDRGAPVGFVDRHGVAGFTYDPRVSGHVFISYARADQDYVERLAAHLASHGIPVWFDQHLSAGDRWDRAILAQIDPCAAFVIVMTPASDDSDWVGRELIQAERLGKPVFPVLLYGEHFFRLANLQFEDVRGDRLPSPAFVARLSGVIRGTAPIPAARSHPSPTRPDLREFVARSRFLSRLDPGLAFADKNDRGFDVGEVERLLTTLRTLAVQNMGELQLFLGTAPVRFREVRGKGYDALYVEVFLNDVDRAMKDYIGYESQWVATGDTTAQISLDTARSRLFSRLRADFDRVTGRRSGYDTVAVNRYLETMRALAAEDMVQFQAFVAFTPNRFPPAKNGYDALDVDVFMNRLGDAVKQYAADVAAVAGLRLTTSEPPPRRL